MQNLMNTVLLGQYEAALSMLRDAIASCPAEHWETKVANDPARFVAFHTLYWTDIYLTRRESEFESHEFVMEGRGLPFGQPFPEGKLPPGLSQVRSLEYADFCIKKAREALRRESESDLAGESGFWQKISRAEMHIYNIRHIQHHTGALSAHIRRLVPEFPEEGMDWIDTGAKAAIEL
jgi:hypothetical protein